MFFGMFGSIFLLTQFLQFALGAGPLEAGVKMLAWTGATVVVAPIAGATPSASAARLPGAGLALQGVALAVDVGGHGAGPRLRGARGALRAGRHRHGAVLRARHQRGPRLGAGRAGRPGLRRRNAIRELGGVFGVAVLSSVFSANGSYASPQAFVDGAVPAVLVGGLVVLAGALVALVALPSRRRVHAAQAERPGDALALAH